MSDCYRLTGHEYDAFGYCKVCYRPHPDRDKSYPDEQAIRQDERKSLRDKVEGMEKELVEIVNKIAYEVFYVFDAEEMNDDYSSAEKKELKNRVSLVLSEALKDILKELDEK